MPVLSLEDWNWPSINDEDHPDSTGCFNSQMANNLDYTYDKIDSDYGSTGQVKGQTIGYDGHTWSTDCD